MSLSSHNERPGVLSEFLSCTLYYCSLPNNNFKITMMIIFPTHIIVEALLGSNLTLVVVLQVERHQVQHVPQRGGAGLLTEHLPARGET